MRITRKRSAERLENEPRTKQRRARSNSGIPKLGLWECGIGSGWK